MYSGSFLYAAKGMQCFGHPTKTGTVVKNYRIPTGQLTIHVFTETEDHLSQKCVQESRYFCEPCWERVHSHYLLTLSSHLEDVQLSPPPAQDLQQRISQFIAHLPPSPYEQEVSPKMGFSLFNNSRAKINELSIIFSMVSVIMEQLPYPNTCVPTAA